MIFRMIGAALLLLAAHPAQAQIFRSSAGDLKVETIASGLAHPWALAFLPDGRMLVTERPGRLRVVTRDGKLSPPVANVPKVFASGQGGLLDVITDRGFAQNRTIYVCYAEPVDGGARTAMARGVLTADETPRLDNVQVIFRQAGPLSRGHHFGCRIVHMPDGTLFLTTGEHFGDRDLAQTLDNHLGKLIRIKPDGSAPADNPFVDRSNAKPEIWSYGHRNMQGLALNPASGKVWEQEHGARGGDEVNIPQAGKNYGWPVISHGVNYDGSPIGSGKSEMSGMEQPVWHWTPSIAPSGMAFYTGNLFPAWKGHLFNGGLVSKSVVRLELNGDKAVKQEHILKELNERIRDVRDGPDGALWVVTDNSAGRILRVTPAK
jgi:glucose/arabinose dehydrogenase